jgi:hypothetical protein
MGFVKSVFIGLAVCAISYFAIFALAMAMAGLLPIAKFVAIGLGVWAMIHYSKES